MAEQYASFQGKEPNIDVNLFVNALTQGIAAGNAQKTTFGAIATGITQGIKGGIDTAQGIQTIRANAAKLEVEEDPEVIQARKDKIKADAEIAKAEAKTKANNDSIEAQAKRAKAEADLEESKQKVSDINIQKTVGDALRRRSPEELNSILNDPGVQDYMRRNRESGNQILAGATGVADPALVKNMQDQINATQREAAKIQLDKERENALQTEAIKQREKIDQATANLQIISPAIKSIMTDPQGYDPEKLSIVKLGNVEWDRSDPQNPKIKFDAAGRPLISARPNTDDTRYGAIYNGELREIFDEESGKSAAKSMSDYQLGSSAITKDTKMSEEPKASLSTVNFQNTGLAGEVSRIDKRLQEATPQTTPKALAPSAESLQGKTPAEQFVITERFNNRLAQLQNIPRQDRDIVVSVNSNPLLKGEKPLIKGLVSVESGGKNDATSPTNVKGLLQVTGPTFEYMKKKYPTVLKDAVNDTPQGELLVGKMYLLDLITQFNDISLALASYNAGPGVMSKAIAATEGAKNWTNVKQSLKNFVSEEKYKEVENYPEKVLRFTSYYNG